MTSLHRVSVGSSCTPNLQFLHLLHHLLLLRLRQGLLLSRLLLRSCLLRLGRALCNAIQCITQ